MVCIACCLQTKWMRQIHDYNSANVQRHAVACSIVVYKPNYKARYTVTTGHKYKFLLYFVYLVVYKSNQVAKLHGYNSAKVQRRTLACSIVVYKPNCKARYTVTTGPKY